MRPTFLRSALLFALAALSLVCARAQEATPSVFMSHAPSAAQLRTHGLAPLPHHLYGRERTSLDGYWKFLVDTVERGLRNQYPRYTIPKDEKQQAVGGPLVEYDFDSAPDISVPGDWNTQTNPRLFWYEGLGWYRRKFDAPATPGERVFLYFEAANYRSHVYLNGEKLGVHEGGFTPFAFEVTGKLKPAGNSLVVGVNSKRLFGNVPGSDADWFNYGGLTRSVWLVTTPATFIQHHHLVLRERDGREIISGAVKLDGPAAANARVTVKIPELAAEVAVTTGADGRATFELSPQNLSRWAPESPKLYAVTFATATDRLEDRVGFRTIATRGTDILLNGRPVYLRGISIHEERLGDHEDDGGRKLDWDDARRLLQEAKDLGCNFVRISHYPHTEKMILLADEMGLLVWSEIPVYQEDIPYEDPHTLELTRRMQAVNIARDQSRASVIVWSVANETPLTDARLKFLKTLIDDARAQDGTRLISAALNRSLGSTTYEIALDDPLGAHLDLLAYNTYYGWYGKQPADDIPRLKWRSAYDKPMILSEFGTDAKKGTRGPKEARWTEDHQAWFYALTIANAETVPWIKGLSPWILKDFRSPRRYRGDYQNYWNRKGLISETGQRKLAWQVLRDHYAKKASPNTSLNK
jgi:beta-glucuronidase